MAIQKRHWDESEKEGSVKVTGAWHSDLVPQDDVKERGGLALDDKVFDGLREARVIGFFKDDNILLSWGTAGSVGDGYVKPQISVARSAAKWGEFINGARVMVKNYRDVKRTCGSKAYAESHLPATILQIYSNGRARIKYDNDEREDYIRLALAMIPAQETFDAGTGRKKRPTFRDLPKGTLMVLKNDAEPGKRSGIGASVWSITDDGPKGLPTAESRYVWIKSETSSGVVEAIDHLEENYIPAMDAKTLDGFAVGDQVLWDNADGDLNNEQPRYFGTIAAFFRDGHFLFKSDGGQWIYTNTFKKLRKSVTAFRQFHAGDEISIPRWERAVNVVKFAKIKTLFHTGWATVEYAEGRDVVLGHVFLDEPGISVVKKPS